MADRAIRPDKKRRFFGKGGVQSPQDEVDMDDASAAAELAALDRAASATDRKLIDEKLRRMGRVSFIRDTVFPQTNLLLALPPQQAREGMIGMMSNIGLMGMLFLSAAVGPALDLPVSSTDSSHPFIEKCPRLTLAYSLLLCFVVVLGAFVTISTMWFVTDLMCVSDADIYGAVVRADRTILQAWLMTNCFFILGVYVVCIRAWMFYYTNYQELDEAASTGEDDLLTTGSYWIIFLMFTISTVLVTQGIIARNCFLYYMDAFPISANYWAKAMAPWMFIGNADMHERTRNAVRRFTLQTRRNLHMSTSSGKNAALDADSTLSEM